ncbi:MAG: hypothetical protein D6718_05235 [Acidobacteria bacterium]|nr:MAG: hypothetical protein D6718_05235 [Acidobacteriota bacterium]
MSGAARARATDPAAVREHAADLVDLAGSYFLGGPTPELERLLRRPRWIPGLVASGVLAADPGGRFADPDRHAREFEALFRIPDRTRAVVPREGAHADEGGRPAAAACRLLYARAGYDMAPFRHLGPDHIGHQLRFAAALLRREAACLERHDDGARARVRSWIEGFAEEHGAWWSRFAEEALRRARSRQVRVMAALAGRVQLLLRDRSAL